jgi:PAS domain S-box-containing protein
MSGFNIKDADREQLAAALRASEFHVGAIYSVSLDPIIVIDNDGTIREFNSAAEQVFVCRRNNAIGTPAALLFHHSSRERFQKNVDRFQSKDDEGSMVGRIVEMRCLRKNGERFLAEMALQPIPFEDVGRLVIFLRDITERKQAELALKDSQRLYASLVENLPLCVIRKGREGHFTFANRAFCEMVGRPLEALIGKTDFDLYPCELAEKYRRDDAQVCETGKSIETTESNLASDGTEHHVYVVKTPVHDSSDKVIGTQILFMDITARVRAEQALRRTAAELEQSNIELQQFAYIASHDLRAPLRGISGFAHFLQQDYQGKIDATADEYLDQIVTGAQRMQQLINDLLAYSRVESRSRPFVPVNLAEMFDDAVDLLRAEIEDAGGQVTRGELPTVLGDRAQLSQLLQNLIGNGLKYHDDAPPLVQVTAERNESGWKLAVRDNGIGIEAKHHERIFEIFLRLHTNDKYPGTGIGLAVCRRIVLRHGGRLWVESQIGHGSTFYFTLPDRSANQP